MCSAKVIYESALMQDFLQLKPSDVRPQAVGGVSTGERGGVGSVATEATRRPVRAAPMEKEVQLRILLPDKTVTMVTVNEFWRTSEVYEVRLHCLHVVVLGMATAVSLCVHCVSLGIS